MTNEAIHRYNWAASNAFDSFWASEAETIDLRSHTALWTSVISLVAEKLDDMTDGIHAPQAALDQAVLVSIELSKNLHAKNYC